MSNPINVLIICHDHGMSGANRSLADWLADIDGRALNPIIVLPRHNEDTERIFADLGCKIYIGNYRFDIYHFSSVAFSRKIKDIIGHFVSLLTNRMVIRALEQIIKAESIDIIHTNSYSCLIGAQLAKRSGLPHVWHIREFMDIDHEIRHFSQSLVRQLSAKSTAIFISDVLAEYHLKRVEFKDYSIIYNKVAYREHPRKRSFMDDGVCRLLIAGTIQPGKGQDQAIAAVLRLKEKGYPVELVICGQKNSDYIDWQIDGSNSPTIQYLGLRSDMDSIRQGIDIALICSKYEAFGRVTVEAMYHRNLVVASNCGCNKKLVAEGSTGFLYEWGNIDNLCEVLERCIQIGPQLNDVIETAREFAVSFFSTGIAERITNVYKQELKLASMQMVSGDCEDE